MNRRNFFKRFFTGLLIARFALNDSFAGQKKSQFKKSKSSTSPRLGINFAGISYWGSELPLKDIFKLSGEWISNPANGKWGSGPALQTDESGWITQLNNGYYASKMLAMSGLYPLGVYKIEFEGEGELDFAFRVGQITEKTKNSVSIKITNNNQPLTLNLKKSNNTNYIKNIRIYLPNENAASDSVWSDSFIKRWEGAACIRFMDFMATNNSPQRVWNDRPKVTDASYAQKGVPVELLVDLANRLNCDAWFCIPHLADDDYVKNFIKYLDQHLKPNLRAWIEYSNEVWNSVFTQSKHSVDIGVKNILAQTPRDAGLVAYAKRCRDIFEIIQSVSENRKRFVCVVASQAANPYVSEKILSFENLADFADVLAIAPYFSLNVAPNDATNDREIMNWGLDKLFDYLETVKLPEAKQWMEGSKKVSERYRLSLVAYEAGQHLTGYRGAENNTQLVDLFLKANADPRMGKLYNRYLKDWEQAGGDLLCAFSSVNVWGKWGSWGLLQHPEDDVEQSYKFKSVIEWAQAHGQSMSLKN